MHRSDSACAVVLLSFALFVSYQAGRYPLGTLRKVGSGFLPFYLGILLAALALIILLRALFAAAEKGAPAWKGVTEKAGWQLRLVSVFPVICWTGDLGKRLGRQERCSGAEV